MTEIRPSNADPFSDAVATLFRTQFESLFRYLDRLTGDPDLARDLAQETFVRLHGRGAMPDNPRGWLATVATNLFRDQRRQNRRRAELASTYAADVEELAEPSAADAAVLARDARSQVRAALDTLSERERTLLLLRHEGYSYRELAHAVGVAEGGVGTMLIRATRMFRQAVGARALTSGVGSTPDPGRRSAGVRHASD